MKVCPTCNQTFSDDALSYCLHDGTQLVTTESQPTLVIERPVASPVSPYPNPKKKKTGLWVGLIIVIMLFGIVVVAGALLLFYNRKGDAANANNRNGGNISPAKSSVTPKPSASPTPASIAPNANGQSKPDTKPVESDDVTPIAWTTSAATFKTDVGQTYKFQCPENGVPEAVWGSDVYTADSSICTAAVHAGIITLEKGGVVTIEFRPGRSTYGSTVRNGITTSTFGEYPHSFVVR